MEKRRIENYDDGYSKSGIVLKAAAAASALLLCGSLASCHRNRPDPEEKIMGNMVYQPSVSDSDISSDDELSIMGEEQYFPVDDDQPDDSYMGDLTVEPSEND